MCRGVDDVVVRKEGDATIRLISVCNFGCDSDISLATLPDRKFKIVMSSNVTFVYFANCETVILCRAIAGGGGSSAGKAYKTRSTLHIRYSVDFL